MMSLKFTLEDDAIVLRLPVTALQGMLELIHELEERDEAPKPVVTNVNGLAGELVEYLNQNTVAEPVEDEQHMPIQEITDKGVIRHLILSALNDLVDRGNKHVDYRDEVETVEKFIPNN